MNIKLQNAIIESCPWWKNPAWTPDTIERDLYYDIIKTLSLKQIISISGLRRVGKTSLMLHIVKDLLKEVNPSDVLFFSFDNFSDTEIAQIFDEYRIIHKKEYPQYLFLDEIQKVNNWQEQLKRIYDWKQIKIFISGSESLFVKNYSKESLAGRIFEYKLKPLSFSEFLKFKGIENNLINRKEIESEFYNYILTGGFPEIFNFTDKKFIREYIYSSIIEKVIFSDIPGLFKIDNISILKTITDIFINNPGMLVELTSFAGDLGISRQTLASYLFYLESSNLVKKLYNFSKNRSTSEKKQKKYYITFPSSALYYDDNNLPRLIENFCVLNSEADFFWRSPQKDEIDIVKLEENKIIPIEIKYSDNHTKNSVKKLSIKDPEKGTVLKLPKKIGDVDVSTLIGHVISKTRKDTKRDFEDKYKPIEEELTKIRQSNTELDEKLRLMEEERENATLDAKQLAEKEAQRKIDKANKDKDDALQLATERDSKYQRYKKRTDMR